MSGPRTANGRRAVPRGHARGGAEVLHRPLRRPGLRGRAARAADRGRRALPRRGGRPVKALRDQVSTPTRSATSTAWWPGSTRSLRVIDTQREERRPRGASASRSPRPQGGDRRRGREAGRRQRLAQRRQPPARPARGVEGAPPPRQAPPTTPCGAASRGARTTYTRRRKAHFAEQHEQRDAARVVKERLAKEAEALAELDRVGPDRRQVPRPDARVEGRRPGAARGRRRAVEAVPRRPGRLLRRPRRRQRRAGQGVRRQRRGQGGSCSSRPRRCCRSPTSTPPSRPSATSPTAGTPPARCRGTG